MISRPWSRVWTTALASIALLGAMTAPQLIHSEKSLYRDIFVYQDGSTRCLCFTRLCAIGRQTCLNQQSPDRLVFEYTKMMLAALFLKPDPNSILVIGLGGGTLPHTLQKLLPDADIDTVEIDPAVVRVAQDYFGFRADEHIHVFIQDGRAYVRQALRGTKRYELIMLDAYEHQYIPEHMLTREFLTEVRSLLQPDGVVAANTFSSSRLYNNESVTYGSVFGQFYNLRGNNRIILAANGPLPSTDEAAHNSRRFVATFPQFDADPQELLAMFSTRPDWDTSARVLTDQYSPANLLNGPP